MYRKASRNPEEDINALAYPGQPLSKRQYRTGFEAYLELLPIMHDAKHLIESKNVMHEVAMALKHTAWVHEYIPDNKFERNIIALESPIVDGNNITAGVELVVAKWGMDFASPVHGHAPGFIYENLLCGKILVNSYRLMDNDKVRLTESNLITKPGAFVATWADGKGDRHERQSLIHNFISKGNSATLHYLPEHTRDGRDNTFEVEYFSDLSDSDLTRIDSYKGMYLQRGDVALVRSENVPEYEDHFIVVTGPPIKKDHGFRIQDIAFHAPNMKRILDSYEMMTGLTLLKLSKQKAEEFKTFHNVKL